MIRPVLFCIILSLLCIVRVQPTQHSIYTKTSKTRVPCVIYTAQARSRITCCKECEQTELCKSVNYADATGECQLSGDPAYSNSSLGINSTDWNNYAKIDNVEWPVLTVPNAIVDDTSTYVGAQVQYTCHQRLVGSPDGNGSVTCFPGGIWSDSPSCESSIIACQSSTIELTCGSGQTIQIIWANYGRTADASVCPHPMILTTSCYGSNHLSIVSAACNGRQTCQVTSSPTIFGDPCPNTYKYLQVDSTCV